MNRLTIVAVTLVSLVGSAAGVTAADSEALTGIVRGARGAVTGSDGIIIDSIAPAARLRLSTGVTVGGVAFLAPTQLAGGDDVRVARSFPGNKGPGWKDSIDVAGAVGSRHVVDFDVASFVVHDKASGKILVRLTTREFWQRVEPVGKLVPQKDANDARMLYDPLSERWFACAAGTTEADCFLAVSTSSDPTKPWYGAKLPLPRINPYMRMGVDRNGLYVCSCNGNSDMSKGTNCYAIPKGDVLADGGPVLMRAQTFKNLQFSTMPAMDPDADKPAGAPAILLANEFADGTCDRMYLYKVTWSGSKTSISDVQTIQLSRKYLTPNNSTPQMEAFQPKPGPKLRAGGGGRRIDSAFVRKGSVFGCNGAIRKPESRPGVLWYEVRISDGRLIQEGFVDSPDRDFIFPSVAVDSKGNIGIGCTGTSETEFPSVYVMMHSATDPANTMRRPVAAVPGTTSYHYAGAKAVNLSHYSTTCIDPSNPDLLWTCQAYANSKEDRQWCTAWAAFQTSDVKRSAPDKSPVTFPSRHEQKPEVVDSAEGKTFTGTATRSGTYKRPLLVVDDKRYELQASDRADTSVAETLARFSKGDTGTYAVKGTRGTVNGKDGIIVESITPAQADPGTAPSAAPKRPGYTIYDRTEGEHKFRLVIPDNLAVVRGILVVGPYSGGDSRDYHEQVWYREFLNLHGFAFLGATNYYLHDYTVMQNALKQLAIDTKHPELVHSPFVATGFSAGGGYTRRLMKADPDKVIAGVVVGSTMKLRGELTDGHRRVPMCVINGDLEREPGEAGGMAKALEPVLAAHRPKGALWGWMAVQGVGHEFAGQEVLALPILDAAVRLRYPADGDVRKGPVKLKPLDPDSGWVADNTTWKTGLTTVTPAKEFKGTVAKSSWLLNQDIAFIYRAYATHEWPLKITSPGPMRAKGNVSDAGSAVTIKVDDSKFAGWTKLELYDGAKKVGELSKGPAEFTVKDLKAGYHAYSVLGTDSKANTRSSNPVLVVVRSGP